MKASAWVRKALQELGEDAQPAAVRNYVLQHDPTVPTGHISLALRGIRARRSIRNTPAKRTERASESLFDDGR
jgi:hypothetical protein